MILQRLVEYADRNNLGADQTYSDKDRKVHWQVELDSAGNFIGIIPRGVEEKMVKGKNKTRHVGEQILIPYTPSNLMNGGKIAHFIVDSAERVFFWRDAEADDKKIEKLKTQHRYYWNLIEECREKASENKKELSVLISARRHSDLIIKTLEDQRAKPGQNIIFAVGGALLTALPDIKKYWTEHSRKFMPSEEAGKSCPDISSGAIISNPKTSHGKIKRVPGGNPSGTSLVANDKAAFQSFGLKDALNAPVSSGNEAKYREALNTLIQKGEHLPPEAVACFWTRKGTQCDPWAMVKEPGDEDVRALLTAPGPGDKNAVGIAEDDFYCLVLSGVGGRVMVRDWMETTVGKTKASLKKWFQDITIIQPDGLAAKTNHKLFALLGAIIREKFDELPPQLTIQLLQAALNGKPPPAVLLSLAVKRAAMSVYVSKDDDPDKFGKEMRRAAVMRLCLLRSQSNQEVNSKMQEKLDQEQEDPAYLCGRLLAMLDRVQFLALGDVGAGVIERMYGAASTTPALVYGRIFNNAQKHLSKMSKEKPGAAVNMEKDLEEVTGHLKTWPKTLDLEGQARFALGFYHQKAAYRARSIENKMK
ncbi:MAG: type I-C CRISPR-associated protein Cas8c/Csd1 [Elusimicrobia bacterium]|nr:type I-C CRISPR-associated protein Cas8c/Csd1 [Elusimicrobiota bacterium]